MVSLSCVPVHFELLDAQIEEMASTVQFGVQPSFLFIDKKLGLISWLWLELLEVLLADFVRNGVRIPIVHERLDRDLVPVAHKIALIRWLASSLRVEDGGLKHDAHIFLISWIRIDGDDFRLGLELVAVEEVLVLLLRNFHSLVADVLSGRN